MQFNKRLNKVKIRFGILFVIILALFSLFACPGPEVTPPEPEDASWIRETIIYQIFVDRFGENLDGVKEKLDYLEELGVKTIWLMPIFKAMSDHGYDTVDYYAIDPRYGDKNDLKELVSAAKQKKIKVILDLVINHLGKDHPWFSSSNPSVRKDHWFVWDANDRGWNLPWGDGKTWHPDPHSHLDRNHNGKPNDDDYFYAVFSPTMPDLNFNDPNSRNELINEIGNIMKFWIDETGVDGFRCDAVRYLVEKGDEEQKDLTETHEIWKEVRKRLERIKPSAILLAEAPTETYEQMVDYYGNGDEFHTAFHFMYQGALMDTLKSERRPSNLMTDLYAIQSHLPKGTQDTIFLSNHDQFAGDRVASQLYCDIAKMKSAASLYLLLSGNPAIYYGEEIGMRGAGSDSELRKPMDWDAVKAQRNNPDSLFNHYRRLLKLRSTYDALRAGITYFVPTHYHNTWDRHDGESKALSIIREYFGEKILIVHNFSRENLKIHIDLSKSGIEIPDGTQAHALMGEGNYETVNDSNRSFYDIGTVYAFASKALFLGNISKYYDNQGNLITYENAVHVACDAWYFRGTPNNWGITLMDCVDDLYVTTQEFGGDKPRFKISHYEDWTEAYPSSDYLITQGPGTYEITFDAASKEISVRKLFWEQAYLRGTPNNWGATPMFKEKDLWVISMTFNETNNPRFKITPHTDWCEAYPSSDYLITQGTGSYRIIFNEITKEITVYKQ
jgi:glycosidase